MTLHAIINFHGTQENKLVLNRIIEPPLLDKALLDCTTRTNRDPKTHFSTFSKLLKPSYILLWFTFLVH